MLGLISEKFSVASVLLLSIYETFYFNFNCNVRNSEKIVFF